MCRPEILGFATFWLSGTGSVIISGSTILSGSTDPDSRIQKNLALKTQILSVNIFE